MATITTFQSTGVSLAPNEPLYVGQTGHLITTSDFHAVDGPGGHTISILGEVAANPPSGGIFTDGLNLGGSTIRIGPTGVVLAPRYAINVGSGTTVINDGTLIGGAAGIAQFGAGVITITNNGTISANLNVALRLEASASLVNTGLISGPRAIDFPDDSGDDRVINFGRMVGSVELKAGNDFFDSREGTVVGTVLGGAGDDTVMGGSNANVFLGGSGDDQLDGNGGDDILDGGPGGDTLNGGAGLDYASYVNALGGGVTASLTNPVFNTGDADGDTYSGIENLSGSGFDDILTGDGLANIIQGYVGADTMTGLAGNDQYYVDNSADRVFESAGGGADRVYASTTYTLTAGSEVEILSTQSISGTTAINLTGNALSNTIIGNTGANRLDGAGGADTMRGGAGNDQYFVDNASDGVFETAVGGSDRVYASTTYTLTAGSEVEVLSTSSTSGTAVIHLAGNDLSNTVIGNAANNQLRGLGGNDLIDGAAGNDHIWGGLGSDTLNGRAGQDHFLFDTALNPATNVDVISDFFPADDSIQLENAIFAGLPTPSGPRVLTVPEFRVGAAAADADDRIIYNNLTGALICDSNGVTAGGATHFATLPTGLALTASDFLVI